MLRALRFLGLLVVHTVLATIGTAIAEHAIWRLIPANSIGGVLWKACTFSIVCATLIGFGMWRTSRNSPAKWTWVLAAPWFAFGLLMRHGDVFGPLLLFHSGNVLDMPDAKSFIVFTVPLIRTTSYSLGAYLSSVLLPRGVTHTEIG